MSIFKEITNALNTVPPRATGSGPKNLTIYNGLSTPLKTGFKEARLDSLRKKLAEKSALPLEGPDTPDKLQRQQRLEELTRDIKKIKTCVSLSFCRSFPSC